MGSSNMIGPSTNIQVKIVHSEMQRLSKEKRKTFVTPPILYGGLWGLLGGLGSHMRPLWAGEDSRRPQEPRGFAGDHGRLQEAAGGRGSKWGQRGPFGAKRNVGLCGGLKGPLETLEFQGPKQATWDCQGATGYQGGSSKDAAGHKWS
jgi:hypothetical protein